jgi:predicted regulator of Ras-like GTPase activity (Roadblock/LC7/MglB family)
MDDELYSFALKNTLDEIRNLCPGVKNAFVFREDGELVAADEGTPEKTVVHAVDGFDSLLEKAQTVGGIELITIEGEKGGVNVSSVNNHYVVTVTSENADKNHVNTMTHVLVTTVLKLLEKISPAPLKNTPAELEKTPEVPTIESNEKRAEELIEQSTEKPSAENDEQSSRIGVTHAEPMSNQFMVEDIGGLLVSADTVRIDKETLTQWQELYENYVIEEVEIETFEGKSARCKVKPIKDLKQEGKGVVQIPQKIQHALEIRKGELVKVKPSVEENKNGNN